jgi:SAM-dependent methyltransferase
MLGGPVKDFEKVGRLQLITLLKAGLQPDSRVVDIGCGCLRAGYWLIHFLGKNRYFGIEPNKEMVRLGVEEILEPEVLEEKAPLFDHNSDFNVGVFEVKFDFFLARSVWTHASKQQIEVMLDAFCQCATEEAIFLASYLPAGEASERDYVGAGWVGISHESSNTGLVSHSLAWVRSACAERSLAVRELQEDVMNGQRWLSIRKQDQRLSRD